jgi:hypothetical protein
MIKCPWAILCERAIVDRETDQLSLIDVLEDLEIDFLPKGSTEKTFYPFGIYLVTYWKKYETSINIEKIRVVINNPLGENFLQAEFPFPDNTPTLNHVHTIHFPGLPIVAEGDYTFKIEVPSDIEGQWNEVNSVILPVIYTADPENEPALIEGNS